MSAKFSKFPGYYLYLLTQLSIFDAVQNPKQIRQTEKIFECRKFFGNSNRSSTSANKKYDRKVLYNFLIFAEKKRRWLFFWDYFFAESAKWSLMIGRFLRWINFLWKLNSCEILGKIGTTSGLKDKNLPIFCKLTTIFTEFFEVFDLSDSSKIRITETFAISQDSLFRN